MIYVTNPENNQEGSIPPTGEWMFSPEPMGFCICLINDTGFLAEYDRIVVHCHVKSQVPSAINPGHYTSELGIRGLTTIVGCEPDQKIPSSAESHSFVQSVTNRLAAAINGWEDGTTEEQKHLLWHEAERGRQDPLELLKQLLSGKFLA